MKKPGDLVGMTMGARERAARREASAAYHACDGTTAKSEFLDEARRKYRIGERLRPCLGCPACDDLAEDHGEEAGQPLWFLHRDVMHPCDYACGGRWLRGRHCDGTGVLPARGRR